MLPLRAVLRLVAALRRSALRSGAPARRPRRLRLARAVMAVARALSALRRRLIRALLRRLPALARAGPALILLAIATRLLLLPDPLSEIREARQLVLHGRIQEAFLRYQELHASGVDRPELLLHLGQVRLLRNEAPEAELLLVKALSSALAPEQIGEAQLAYGWSLALQGRHQRAEEIWRRLPARLQGRAAVLRGEVALRRGDPQAALAATRQALGEEISGSWRALATYRLALLQGAESPSVAAQPGPADNSTATAAWVLTPLGAWPDSLWQERAERLRQALSEGEQARRLAIAGLLAEEGFLLAARQLLHQGAPEALETEQAVLFDVQIRRALGDRAGALAQLRAATERFPNSPVLLRLLALFEAEERQPTAASTLERAAELDPAAPDNTVIEAAFKRIKHEYFASSEAYDMAIGLATPERRPLYHLHAARFYYDTTWRQCKQGLDHARQAASGLSGQLDAWVLLGEMLLRCSEYHEARKTAATMVERWPDQPASHFIRGAALLGLNDDDRGREALLRAANLAPASSWRVRVEELLAH